MTHKAFVLWVPLCLLAALSLFIPSASTISEENVDVNVNLVNGVAIRILNSAATAEITELDLSATAAPTGTFVTDNFKVEVSTANKTGYKLYMNSSYQNPSTSTYTTDLVNQTNTSYTIPTIAADTTKSALSTAAPGTTNANKWAYSLDDATYSPVPVNSVQTQIGSHDTPTAGTQTPVYIGMNVNVEKPSGVYKNQLTFSAVGNPVPTAYSLYFEPGTTDPVAGLPDPNPMTASAVATSYTFTIPSTVPTRAGYSFTGYLDESTSTTYQPGGTITVLGDIDYTGSATLVAQWGIVSSTLTVDPNGGTWSGSTSTQTFPGDYGSTKVIGTPSANATYTISYNDNSQSATYSPNPPAPTSVSRPFTGWTLTATGGGSPSGSFDTTTNTYTYNIASDTLTAGYNTTSNTFTLPTVTKTGHTCTWHENSASGTSHTSGETNVTITANTEFYAVCTTNSHNVTVTAGTNIASTTGSGSHNYGSTVNIGATASTGYHFSSWTVNSGGVTISNDSFTMPDNDVSVTANGTINTCSIHYNVNTPSGTTSSGSTADSSFNYNTVTATTANGFSATGYNWAGWAESAGGTAVITTSGGSITAAQAASWCGTHGTTKNLYAKWTKKYTYTLNLNTNDGTTNKQILNYPSSGGTTDTSHQFTSLNTYAPTREGYNFLGWATSSTGTSYVTSYTLNSSSASSTPTTDGFPVTGNLYAQWEVAIHYIQNQTYIDECKAAATGTEFELTDSRDNNEYTVAKLADGKCWMTENLKLVGNATVGYTDLTTTDSDVPAAGFRLTSSNSGTWCTTDSADCDNQSMVLNSGNDSYGTYYNWYAATAGTGKYETSTDGTNVANSICPRGWRLPTSGSSGEFQALYNNYNSVSAMMSSPVNFVLSGYRNDSSTYDQGSYGGYWSSTASDSDYAYKLFLRSTVVKPAGYGTKYGGQTVRCVAR